MATQNICKLHDNTGTTVYPITHVKAIVGLSEAQQCMTSVTYAEIVDLRNNNELIPGMMYRITDYACTTTQDDTQSAGHVFDIIVTAVEPGKVSELAKAVQHEGDTYFANSNLEAWQLWYDLDNDIAKYLWADPDNGKGVIYRMIDEFDNDCPYDFKNIQFKRYWSDGIALPDGSIILQGYFAHDGNSSSFTEGVDSSDIKWFYTFSIIESADSVKDSIITMTVTLPGEGNKMDLGHSNKISKNIDKVFFDDSEYLVRSLNDIVFIEAMEVTVGDDPYRPNHVAYNNKFGENCTHFTAGSNVHNNTFGNDCYSNTFGNYCDSNTFGNDCDSNTFGNDCYSNTFGNYCYSNTFGVGVLRNDLKFDYVIGVRLDDTVAFINLKPADGAQGTTTKYLSNIHVLRGVHGATRTRINYGTGYAYSNTSNRLDVVIDTYAQDYEICVGFTQNKTLKIWSTAPED